VDAGTEIAPPLRSALAEQLEQRRAALECGARHVGWKLGMGNRERIGGHIAVGYLTSESVLEPGEEFRADRAADLHADAEAVVELGEEVAPGADPTSAAAAIGRYGAGLELVDLRPLPGEPLSVVVGNVFHRAVAFGPLESRPPTGGVRLLVNGCSRAAGSWPSDLPARLAAAARLLGSVGERLRAGDRVLTGSIVQVPLEPLDEVVALFADRWTLGLRVSRP
jgi:2-keto-4-pentenoate hydratase